MDAPPAAWPRAHAYDGGDLSCGQLLLDLRHHFQSLPAGAEVVVRAVDEGAPVEVPAWCRVTGHVLLDEAHPFYLIRKQP